MLPLGADVARLSSRRQKRTSPSVPASSGAASDAELARQLRDADGAALSGLYQRFGQSCYSLARRVCADDALAEDVVHEVFLTLWREPSRCEPVRGSVAAGLLTLVHHKAVDAIRSTSAARPCSPEVPELNEPATVAGADQAALGRVAAGQVRAALDRLPGEQRQVLAAAYFGGHTLPEIATFSGVPVGIVKSRLVAGVQRLQSLLTEQLGPDALIAETRAGWEPSR